MKRFTHNVFTYLLVVLVLALWLSADDLERVVYAWSMR